MPRIFWFYFTIFVIYYACYMLKMYHAPSDIVAWGGLILLCIAAYHKNDQS